MKRKHNFLVCIFTLSSYVAWTQTIGINEDGSAPNSSVILDIKSADKGILIPRTDTSSVSNAGNLVTGTLIFQNSDHTFYYYNGTTWASLGQKDVGDDQVLSMISDTIFLEDGGFVDLGPYAKDHRIVDTDGDTQVQVEWQATDQDQMRIILNGAERYRFTEEGLEIKTDFSNAYVGQYTGNSNSSGDSYNAYFGYNIGTNSTGDKNVAVGIQAGQELTSGSTNTILGYVAGKKNSTGSRNTFLGASAGYSNINGERNIAVGESALEENASGNRNTAIGFWAGWKVKGSRNVILGYDAGPTWASTQNDRLYIDNHRTNSPLIYGEFDNHLIRVNGRLSVGGNFTANGDVNVGGDLSTNGSATVIGHVGIGVTNPFGKLHVRSGGPNSFDFRVASDGVHINDYSFPLEDGNYGQVLTSDGNGQVSWEPTGDDEDWTISGNNMYSSVSGNVGINNTNPTASCHIRYAEHVPDALKVDCLSDGETIVTDQESTSITDPFDFVNTITQTFTAGVSGKLQQIIVPMKHNGPSHTAGIFQVPSYDNPTMELYSNGNLLGSSSTQVWVNMVNKTFFDGSNIDIVAGQTYAIKISKDVSGSSLTIGGNENYIDLYPGGQITQISGNSGNSNGDIKFSVKVRVAEVATALSVKSNSGNVGVQNSNPSASLDVVGTFQLDHSSKGPGRVLTSDANGNATWQAPNTGTDNQTLTLTGDQLSLEDGGNIDLASYMDNTDEQSLTIDNSNAELSISNGNSVRLSSILDQDGNTGIQVEESTDDNSIRFDIQGSEAMMISEFGQVGIADTDPTEGLLTVGGVSNTAYPVHSAHRYGHGGNQVANTSSSYSIWASGRISAHAFHARSDERIKTVKGVSDSASDLQKLIALEVTDYAMIDTIAHGAKQHKKLIAQQVDKVYPQAVNKSIRAAIPDIYRIGEIQNGKIQLPTDLRVGDHIKIIYGERSDELEVLEVEEQSFTIDSDHEGSVFVYGRYVDDLHTVDYEAISMLNVSATQELVKQMAEQRSQNEALRTKIKSLESDKIEAGVQMDEVITRLSQLERIVNAEASGN